ncbi:MAG: serine/threonine protein kinase [Aridibacter famidurans]|nr:serine/threonine protein kinase [Aridibacter famidurans]
MRALQPETVIQGRYRIKELIGKGGMGQVYLAVDQRLGHSVALKRTTVAEDPSLADAFENEARTLAQLRHPFLPKVSDHFIEEDEQFLVMEYIAGDDLSQRLKGIDRAFPLNWVLFWADELLETLSYLHTHNPPIIHRDIKPQNLKLTSDNHIVLLDFGLSKHSVGHTKITTSGSVVGYTPHYAPMEQIRGTGTSALSDIYALSATLYHLLTNRIPPDALTRADAMLGGQPDPLRPLTELNGEISEVISDTILKGMELNQDNRFRTAREMQKCLRKAYSELQQSMSAETVAFNVADLAGADEGIAGDKTEVITGTIPGVPEPVGESIPEGDKTEVIDADQMRELTGTSGTSEYDSGSEQATFDKTEVMADMPYSGSEDAGSEDVPSTPPEMTVYETNEDLQQAGSEAQEFATNEDFGADGFYSEEEAGEDQGLDKTVAGIGAAESLRESADASEFSADAGAGDVEDFGFTEQYSPSDVAGDDDEDDVDSAAPVSVAAAQAAEVAPAHKKSSTGKYVAILLGLGAVLVLVFGTALGVGWYMLGGSSGSGQTTDPTPAVTPEQDATPDFASPESTPFEEPQISPEDLPSPEAESSPGAATPTPGTRRTPTRTTTRTPPRTPPRTGPPSPPPPTRKPPKTLPTILQ